MRFVLLISCLSVVSGCSRVVGQSDAALVQVTGAASEGAQQSPPSSPVKLPQTTLASGELPTAGVHRVLIFSVDGLRPDVLLRAYMPRVREMCKSGSFTFWAETSREAYTLPCHVSMLTGTPSEKHGVTWNDYIEESYPNVPTLFEIAKQAGLTTAMATGKMKFIVFTKPGALDTYYLPPDEPVTDQEVATQAVRLIRDRQPHVMFVHLANVDAAGHDFGWGSSQQIAAAEQADRAVGIVLDVLDDLNLKESTLVMLTADHGGSGKTHGEGDPRSQFIPWIAVGPGLKKDHDLTLDPERRIGVETTFATACAFLGLDPGKECTAEPVLGVTESDSLQP